MFMTPCTQALDLDGTWPIALDKKLTIKTEMVPDKIFQKNFSNEGALL